MNPVLIVTYPDYYHDKSKKVCLINLDIDEKIAVSEWLLKQDLELTIYQYNNEDHLDWLLNVVNQSNSIYINVDNSKDISYYYISYLVSLPNTKYSSIKLDYSPINKGKVSNIYEYMERDWLGQR